MPVKAVIFDLDGTLLDSLTDIANAANWVLDSHEFPTHDIQAYRYFVGDGLRCLLRRILPEGYADDITFMRQLVAEFDERYAQTWNVHSSLYEGIPQLLDSLVQRDLALAVISNKPHAATTRCVDYYLSHYPFAAVLGQTAQRPPKPDLTGANEVLEKLNVQPRTCIYLGDTAADMKMACGAAMFPVGASWGFRPSEELEQAGAQLIIDHPTQLLEVLQNKSL